MNTFVTFFKNKELRYKFLMTTLILMGIRFLSNIPTLGINPKFFQGMLTNNSLLGFMNAISGNGFSRLSVMTLSITPYINASIIMQLLATIIPKLSDLQRSSRKNERDLFTRYTIILSVVLGLIEAITLSIVFGKQGLLIHYTWYWVLFTSITWMMGVAIASLASKLITDRFVGNGMTLILLCNILASYFSDGKGVWDVINQSAGNKKILFVGVAIVSFLILFVFCYLIQEIEKRIPISIPSESKMGREMKFYNYLPIKLCPAGVMPAIFASSIFSVVSMVFQLLKKTDTEIYQYFNTQKWFLMDHPKYTLGILVYIAFMVSLTFFYTSIVLNPLEIAENLRKTGCVIEGCAIGNDTAIFIKKAMKKYIAAGSIYMTLIMILPFVLNGLIDLPNSSFLGTSILITVSGMLEFERLLKSLAYGNAYEEKAEKKGSMFYV